MLALELELSERSTQDYADVTLNPAIKQAIDAALDDSEELSLQAAQNLPSMPHFSYDPEGAGRRGRKPKKGLKKPPR